MTDLEYLLKDEIQKCYETISQATRRKNILAHYLLRLRLQVKESVVRAEIAAAGEDLPIEVEAEP